MKALDLLKKSASIEERAEAFVISIKRNIQRDVLDKLTARKEAIDDKLFELANFSLLTNINEGAVAITKDAAEARFKEIINLEFELTLITKELEIKQASFDKYFADGQAES